ncbi:hypothetical protein [Levilactobacillus brevis]|uniref:hypothetical protein n=1 Tax=Levilactobacillus brevis TaxID=1580 RepID=UPI001BA8D0C7|nr:hypothetical protein [Levilactobacillus brevis]MBS0977458.1 hypothetical protein [Levilactobacillus brevis]
MKERVHVVIWVIVAALLIGCPFLIQWLMNGPFGTSLGGTNDGWLGFWGGYLGAIITVMGVYLQISLERKREQERIKQERIADLQKKALENFLNLIHKVNGKYELIEKCYDVISYLMGNLGISTDNIKKIQNRTISCYDRDYMLDDVKSFVFQINDFYNQSHNELKDIQNQYNEIYANVVTFKIHNLQFFPFALDNGSLSDINTSTSQMDLLVKNIKSDFEILKILTHLSSIYGTYLLDKDLENIVANLSVTGHEQKNIIDQFEYHDFKKHKKTFDKLMEDTEKAERKYISKANI